MANEVPSWFDATAYLKNKVAVTNGINNELELIAAFKAAGYTTDAEGLYQHYIDYGKSEGVSPASMFDANEYMYSKVIEQYGAANATPARVKYMWTLFEQAGLSPWEHYEKYGAWETVNGKLLNPSTGFDASAYMDAKLAQMQKDEPAEAWTMEKLVEVFQSLELTPLTHYLAYGKAENVGYKPAGEGTPGSTQYLEGGADRLMGTSGDDYFHSGAGTLDDNDELFGGGGYDTLHATLKSNSPAVQPTVVDVEKVVLQAQDEAYDTGSNLPDSAALDAGRIEGMTWLQNDNSRAALTVEDVRTNSNVMTIEWSNSDAGKDMDYTVHFDNQHLKADGQAYSGTLYLRVMDVEGGDTAEQPLLNNPYDKFIFQYTPSGGAATQYTLQFRAADADKFSGTTATYASLLQAFKNAIEDFEAANPAMKGVLSVEQGAQWTGTSGTGASSWSYEKGYEINLTASKGIIEANNSIRGTGWAASGAVPPSSALVTDVAENPVTDCPLIKTNVVLDNVGRVQWGDNSPTCLPDDSIYGSEAGELTIGGMANRGGVERIDIKVDQGSWISKLQSTNEALRYVEAVNEDTNGDGVNGNTKEHANVEGKGQLFIGKQLDQHFTFQGETQIPHEDYLTQWTDAARLLSTDGLVDVKEFNGSKFEGSINLGASITARSFNKYMRSVDGTGKIDGKFAPNGDFKYDTGEGSDVINMKIDTGIAADNDFKMVINTNNGNDFVNLRYNGSFSNNQLLNMKYLDNVHVNTGSGEDWVKSWGNGVVRVDAGSGNDAVYVGQNNHDQNAVWVFNVGGAAASNTDRAVFLDNINGSQPLRNDLEGDVKNLSFTKGTLTGDKVQATINFLGFTKTVDLYTQTAADTAATKNITLTTRQVNQAIIKAINEDPTLSKLLLAKDGAGDSLIIESLIDGDFTAVANMVSFEWMHADGTSGGPLVGVTDEYLTQFALEVSPTSTTNITGGFTLTGGACLEDDVYIVTIMDASNSIVHAQQTASAVSALSDADLATLLNTATGATGLTFADGIADGSSGTLTVAGLVAGGYVNITRVNSDTATDTVSGKDWGTLSHNWVNLGLGDDVITLNTNHLAGGADFVDTLIINGEFGNDKVVHFDGFATGAGVNDRIDISALMTYAPTTANPTPSKDAGWDHDNFWVIDNGGFAHDANNKTGIYTAKELFDHQAINNLTANNKGVVFVFDTPTNTYTVFRVENDNDNNLELNEIKVLGTIHFDNFNNGAAANFLTDGDILA